MLFTLATMLLLATLITLAFAMLLLGLAMQRLPRSKNNITRSNIRTLKFVYFTACICFAAHAAGLLLVIY